MTDQTPAADQLTARVYGELRIIDLYLAGAPNVPNRYGSGTIKPTEVQIRYHRNEDGSRTTSALLEGKWQHPDGELTDAPCSQDYRPSHDWPVWLTQLANDHRQEKS